MSDIRNEIGDQVDRGCRGTAAPPGPPLAAELETNGAAGRTGDMNSAGHLRRSFKRELLTLEYSPLRMAVFIIEATRSPRDSALIGIMVHWYTSAPVCQAIGQNFLLAVPGLGPTTATP